MRVDLGRRWKVWNIIDLKLENMLMEIGGYRTRGISRLGGSWVEGDWGNLEGIDLRQTAITVMGAGCFVGKLTWSHLPELLGVSERQPWTETFISRKDMQSTQPKFHYIINNGLCQTRFLFHAFTNDNHVYLFSPPSTNIIPDMHLLFCFM
jgi:hypothetical protein